MPPIPPPTPSSPLSLSLSLSPHFLAHTPPCSPPLTSTTLTHTHLCHRHLSSHVHPHTHTHTSSPIPRAQQEITSAKGAEQQEFSSFRYKFISLYRSFFFVAFFCLPFFSLLHEINENSFFPFCLDFIAVGSPPPPPFLLALPHTLSLHPTPPPRVLPFHTLPSPTPHSRTKPFLNNHAEASGGDDGS